MCPLLELLQMMIFSVHVIVPTYGAIFFTYMKLLLFAILFPFSYCGGFSPSIENLGLSNQRRHVNKKITV
jgi:hypothetical protein